MTDLLGGMPITRQDMLGCARRELAMRQRAYPRFVQQGRMTADEATRETAIMGAIVQVFEGEAS